MSVQNPPAYRIAWRAQKHGKITHAIVTDLHPLVRAAWLADPSGGPFTDDQLEQEIGSHSSLGVRTERPSDRRCQVCTWVVAGLDTQCERAAGLWAAEQLSAVLAELALSAPIAPPAIDR